MAPIVIAPTEMPTIAVTAPMPITAMRLLPRSPCRMALQSAPMLAKCERAEVRSLTTRMVHSPYWSGG